jgi:hypothetical protein
MHSAAHGERLLLTNCEKLVKKVVNVKIAGITLCVQKTRGAIKQRAEIIPKEPDAGNAAEGKAKVKRTQVHSPVRCRFKPVKTTCSNQ